MASLFNYSQPWKLLFSHLPPTVAKAPKLTSSLLVFPKASKRCPNMDSSVSLILFLLLSGPFGCSKTSRVSFQKCLRTSVGPSTWVLVGPWAAFELARDHSQYLNKQVSKRKCVPSSKQMTYEEYQNTPHQNVPLWRVFYFELQTVRAQQTQEQFNCPQELR